nr:hypothetical protein CFP56_72885 [Quercus suber]
MIIAMKIVWDRLEITYAIGKKSGVIRKALGMMLDIETSSIVRLTWLYETQAKYRKQWSVNLRVLCAADDRECANAKHERCDDLSTAIPQLSKNGNLQKIHNQWLTCNVRSMQINQVDSNQLSLKRVNTADLAPEAEERSVEEIERARPRCTIQTACFKNYFVYGKEA